MSRGLAARIGAEPPLERVIADFTRIVIRVARSAVFEPEFPPGRPLDPGDSALDWRRERDTETPKRSMALRSTEFTDPALFECDLPAPREGSRSTALRRN